MFLIRRAEKISMGFVGMLLRKILISGVSEMLYLLDFGVGIWRSLKITKRHIKCLF